MNKASKIAMKITSEIQVDSKLFSAKSKSTIKNVIYKKIHPLISGYFRDKSWEHVHRVFYEIESMGVRVSYGCKNGGYFQVDGQTAGKKYDFEIEFDNEQNKHVSIKGQLVCTFRERDQLG